MPRGDSARKVVRVFWRKLDATSAGALLNETPPSGTGAGAKHIPIHANIDIVDLLGGPSPSGGTTSEPIYAIPVEGPGGIRKTLEIEFDIRGNSNPPRQEWRVLRQNAGDRHPAWKPGGKLPNTKSGIVGNYIFLFRLADGSVHARVAPPEEVARMPKQIREHVLAESQGLLIL